MNTHEKLDTILRYMTKSASEIPLRPETIAEKAHVNIGRTEMYLILDLLNDDGYVQDTHKDLSYVIKYKGVVFIENGGYTLQHKVFKRKKSIEKVMDYSNYFIKPSIILLSIYLLVQFGIYLMEKM